MLDVQNKEEMAKRWLTVTKGCSLEISNDVVDKIEYAARMPRAAWTQRAVDVFWG